MVLTLSKRITFFLGLIFLVFFSACSDDDDGFTRISVNDDSEDPIFLVSLYDLNTITVEEDLQAYVTDVNRILADYSGAYVYSPIENQGDLNNESSPPVVTPFPGDYLTIIRFQNQAFLDAFLEDAEQEQVREEWQARIGMLNRFTVIEQLNPDGSPQSPIIPQEDLGEDPVAREDGVLLSLVGISFSSDPQDQIALDSFFATGFPLLFQAGLSFSGAFFKVADIEGTFNYDALNFAFYTSSAAFFQVHNSDPFRQLANELRNPTLTAFAENQGRISVEISVE